MDGEPTGMGPPGTARRGAHAGVERFVEVAVDVAGGAGDRAYTYRLPLSLADLGPGEAVLVEFGRRQALAVILGDAEPPEGIAAKPVAARVRSDGPLLPPLQVALVRSVARHYLAPLALVVRAALPPGMLERLELVALAGDGAGACARPEAATPPDPATHPEAAAPPPSAAPPEAPRRRPAPRLRTPPRRRAPPRSLIPRWPPSWPGSSERVRPGCRCGRCRRRVPVRRCFANSGHSRQGGGCGSSGGSPLPGRGRGPSGAPH